MAMLSRSAGTMSWRIGHTHNCQAKLRSRFRAAALCLLERIGPLPSCEGLRSNVVVSLVSTSVTANESSGYGAGRRVSKYRAYRTWKSICFHP